MFKTPVLTVPVVDQGIATGFFCEVQLAVAAGLSSSSSSLHH